MAGGRAFFAYLREAVRYSFSPSLGRRIKFVSNLPQTLAGYILFLPLPRPLLATKAQRHKAPSLGPFAFKFKILNAPCLPVGRNDKC